MYVSEGQAAVELFFRLNHARQTMDYVRRQVSPLVELPAEVRPMHQIIQHHCSHASYDVKDMYDDSGFKSSMME